MPRRFLGRAAMRRRYVCGGGRDTVLALPAGNILPVACDGRAFALPRWDRRRGRGRHVVGRVLECTLRGRQLLPVGVELADALSRGLFQRDRRLGRLYGVLGWRVPLSR